MASLATTLSPQKVITSYEPSKSEKCPNGSGTVNVWENKLQGTNCYHCKKIYDDAKKWEEDYGVVKTYELHVAHSLCSQS